jgi:glyceraldehyde 3-phosphate dehydrogenase
LDATIFIKDNKLIMMKKIAINGFGRIGRLAARQILTRFSDELEIVGVNDITSPENLAYLFEKDTTYRKFDYPIKTQDGDIIVSMPNGEKRIKVCAIKDPSQLPWKDLGVDLVIESTGLFRSPSQAGMHLSAGAGKVIISAPGKKDEDGTGTQTVVLGCNIPEKDAKIVNNGSCTTNCITPALKILQDKFGIEKAFGVTVHAYTATQPLQDGPTKKNFRDGRAGGANTIPSETGAAVAVVEILPELNGKLSLSSLRVPVITGSMVYCTAQLKNTSGLTKEVVNQAFEEASMGAMKGILEVDSSNGLVSSDIIGNPHSSIIDASLTEVIGDAVNFTAWYDNEWGYTSRLVELARIF